MTYFLPNSGDLTGVKPSGRDVQPTGVLDGLGAGFNKAALENDANFRLMKERERESRSVAEKAWNKLGDETVRAALKERDVYVAGDTSTAALKSNLRAIPSVLELAREAAAADPDAWVDLDVSDKGLNETINKRFQSEHKDAEDILNMMPEWRGAVEFMGGMAGMVADIKNVPFILGGGGGSIMRVMGREALLNTAAEAAFLPAQYEMADRLGIPDPNVPLQLAMAAGAGAILGGAVEAGSRAFMYARGRNRMPPMADPVFDAGAMDAAEDAIVAGQNPFEAAQRVQADAPPRPDPLVLRDPIKREPLILRDPIKPDLRDNPVTQPQAVETVTPRIDSGVINPKGLENVASNSEYAAIQAEAEAARSADNAARTAALAENPNQALPDDFSDPVLPILDVLSFRRVPVDKTITDLMEAAYALNRPDLAKALADFAQSEYLFAQKVTEMQASDAKAGGYEPDTEYRAKVEEDALAEVSKAQAMLDAKNAAPEPLADPLDAILDPRMDEARAIEEGSTAAIAEAMANDRGAAKPLVSWLTRGHRVTKAEIVAAEKAGRAAPTGGENMQVDPTGPAAQELRSMGVTPKTAPGLFSKNGRKDFDNLPAAEMEERFPGITDAAGISDDGTYLSRQGFLDVIARDANGDASWLASRADVARIIDERDAALRALEDPNRSAADAFRDMKPADDGFFVDLDAYAFDDPMGGFDRIRADFDAYFRQQFPDYLLTPDERLEIIAELQKSGGEAKHLVERVLERDLDYVDLPPNKADDYGTYDPEDYLRYLDQSEAGRVLEESGGGAGRPNEDAGSARGGPEGEGYGSGAQRTESTSAGEQTLIDGVAPITARDRMEARQQAPMGNGRAEPDSQIGGLFDPDDKVRTDMFSEPASPQARPMQDAVRADIDDQIAKADFDVDMGDGLGVRPASSVLKDLDLDDDFMAVLDACGKGGR